MGGGRRKFSWGGTSTAALFLTLLNGCGARPTTILAKNAATPSYVAAPRSASESATLSPARWVLLPNTAQVVYSRQEPDGSLHLIASGARIEERPDGSIVQAQDLLPSGMIKVLPLPERLGKGQIFFTDVERATWIWRSETWTSPLVPLARIEPSIQQVIAGFDRLYLSSSEEHELRAIDSETGAALDLGSLPAAAAYHSLAFADPWLAAVSSDVRGLLVTFDAGNTWRPLDPDGLTARAYTSGTELGLSTTSGNYRLDPFGTLTRRKLFENGSPDNESFDGDSDTDDDIGKTSSRLTVPHGAKARLLGDSTLRLAVLSGFVEGKDIAVVATRGSLWRIRLSDGLILETHADAYAGQETCQALKLGEGAGFLCGAEVGRTAIYAYQPSFTLDNVLEFQSPRQVIAGQNGALLIRGHCRDDVNDSENAYCARDRQGHLREIIVPSSVEQQRVAVLADGRVAVLTPPVNDRAGTLKIISDSGVEAHPLSFERLTPSARKVIAHGLWMDGLEELETGELATWVVGSGPFVGVRIALDGRARASETRDGIAQAALNGAFGVVLTAGGIGYETTNHGFDWRTFKVPVSIDWQDLGENSKIDTTEVHGCSALGCVFGNWLRLGFGEAQGSLADPPEPPRVTHFTSSSERWALDCSAPLTHEGPTAQRIVGIQPAETTPEPEHQSETRDRNLESSSFRRFLRIPPPPRTSRELGLDIGNDERRVQFRSYAWGPSDERWSSSAQWVVRVADRFDVSSVWSTAASRIAWDEPAIASRAYGQDPGNTGSVDWAVILESDEKSGILRVRARGATELYLLEKDHPILPIKNGAALDLDRIAGIARVGEHWYVGNQRPNALRVYQLGDGEPKLIGSYPQFAPEAVRTELVRSREGDALGILIKSRVSGWYLYPINLETAEAQVPLHLLPEQLAVSPPLCDPGEQGWEVISDVPLTASGGSNSNIFMEFSGSAAGFRAHQLEARLIISNHGICVTALAAQTETPSDFSISDAATNRIPTDQKPLPLTLTDRTNDQRYGFRCGR